MANNNIITINLDDLCDALETCSPDLQYYLDLKTGDIKMESTLDDCADEDDAGERDWSADQYVYIPTLDSSQAYSNMETFVEMVEDEELKGELCGALNQRKPFRHFKDVLEVNPEEQIRWFDFHNNFIRDNAIEWLDTLDIDYDLVEHPTKPVEEQIEDKKETAKSALENFVELCSALEEVVEIAQFGSLVNQKKIAKDIDIMLFITDNKCIPQLSEIYRKVMGRRHQSIDVFVIDNTGTHLGNICFRKRCPGRSIDCDVFRCGEIPFIKRFVQFEFTFDKIKKEKVKLLYHNDAFNDILINKYIT